MAQEGKKFDAAVAEDTAGFGGGDYARQNQELTLSADEFDELRDVIKELTGIDMGGQKQQLVYRRVASRLKATGISTFREYLDYLNKGDPSELENFANAVTTNLTSFFREEHHFGFLANTIIPEIATRKAKGQKRFRIWSAGCSTGEEPYSIAMTVRESFPNLSQWDAKILCTDLDSEVLKTCKAGIYAQDRVDKISQKRLQRWFKDSGDCGSGAVRVGRMLTDLLVFKQLNLMHDWPMRGRFDVIFCRNVIIYFDKPTQRVLIDRYADALEDGGYLILGHSESLFNVSERFELLGQTVYRKIR